MTSLRLVDTDTGEVVDLLTAEEARDLTDGIRDDLEIVWSDVVKAYERQAWRALGYDSWDAYTTAEFASARLRLPREERQEVVQSLTEAGLSTRAIAAATGQSESNVRNDQKSGAQEVRTSSRDRGEVEPRFGNKVKGLDGKTYTRPQPETLTREEQIEVDLVESDKRSARAVQKAIDTWPYLHRLRTNKRRDLIIAHLPPPDVEALAKIEESLK